MARIASSGEREQVEPQDVLDAGRLIEYFKVHARRVQIGLRGENPRDQLAAELKEFLREHGGEWEGEPSVLHEELLARGSQAIPARPDELSKTVLDISSHSASLEVDRAWRKHDGKSRRVLKLLLKNGVDGVDGVDREAVPGNTDNTDNTVYANFREGSATPTEADNTVYTDAGVKESTHSQSVEVPAECGHGYVRGEGCYLCDPNHPYRVEQKGGAA